MFRFIKEFGIVGLIALTCLGVPIMLVSCILCEVIYLGFYPVTS